jgi:hypothetical protein
MTLIDEYSASNLSVSSPNGSTARVGLPPSDPLDSSTPNIETPAYQRSVPRWQKVRDVFQGTEAVRARGETYLPQFAGESDTLYDARRTIAGLFNGFARTVLAAVGLLCDPEPVLGDDMPQPLVDLWENVDGAGTHGAVQARHLTTAALLDGFAGLFTDYPRANDPRIDRSKASLAATVALETGAELDEADMKAMGLRPYFIVMKADEVLPIYETVNGKRTLVLFIRRESVMERKGKFGFENVTRYRVYERQPGGSVTYERWSVVQGGGTPTKDEGPLPMRNVKGIPWSPLVTGEQIGENEYKPTFLDLADLTITHHRIATGILSLEEQACVPTMVLVGRSKNDDGTYDDVPTGPSNVIDIPIMEGMPAVPAFFLSPPVDVLEPAMKSLENCKAEMGAMGATFLAPEPRAQETATAHRMDAAAERATISSVSRALKDCLESAFGFAAQFMKLTAGSVTVNTDFVGEGVDPVLLAQVIAAFQAGLLTMEETRHFLQTGQFPETCDAEDTRKVLAQFAPTPSPASDGTDPLAASPTPDITPIGRSRAARSVKQADGSILTTLE